MPDQQIQCWYEQTYQFINNRALEGLDWADVATAVTHQQARVAAGNYVYASILPVLTCEIVGGTVNVATPIASSWVLYDLASDIFDDVADGDYKDLPWNSWDAVRATNVGLGILAAAQLCLSLIQAKPEACNEIQGVMAQAFLLAARGQALSKQAPSLSWYFEHILGKSGLVFATVAWSGARLQTLDPNLLRDMHNFGMALGALIQIADDCYDLMPKNSPGDFSMGIITLPVIYALSQKDHPQYARLAALVKAWRSITKEEIEEANQILTDMNALAYSISVAKVYEQKALAILDKCCIEASSYLRNYVSQLLPAQPAS